MDKTIEQLLKAFGHVARELQIYLLPGVLVLLNILLINYFYYENSFHQFYTSNIIFIIFVIISYVFGHLSMAFYYVLIEYTGTEKILNSWLKFKYKVPTKNLPAIYKEDTDAYFHFVERYAILTLMRSTLSSYIFDKYSFFVH